MVSMQSRALTLLATLTTFAPLALASQRLTLDVRANEAERDMPTMIVPDGYDANVKWPLVIELHGQFSNGSQQDFYFGLGRHVDERGFLLLIPEGMRDGSGQKFWNATPACCAPDNSTVDDVAYLKNLLAEIETLYNVDPERIYVTGQSAGGFMAHRLGCELSDRLAGIASQAGHNFKDTSLCVPTHPLSVLHIHGTADSQYGGSSRNPTAEQSVGFWATYNQCGERTQDTSIDIVSSLLGNETERYQWQGCQAGRQVEFWKIRFGLHVPPLNANFSRYILDFLLAQRRPQT